MYVHNFIVTFPCVHKCTIPMDPHTFMSGILVYTYMTRPAKIDHVSAKNSDFVRLYSIITC